MAHLPAEISSIANPWGFQMMAAIFRFSIDFHKLFIVERKVTPYGMQKATLNSLLLQQSVNQQISLLFPVLQKTCSPIIPVF